MFISLRYPVGWEATGKSWSLYIANALLGTSESAHDECSRFLTCSRYSWELIRGPWRSLKSISLAVNCDFQRRLS